MVRRWCVLGEMRGGKGGRRGWRALKRIGVRRKRDSGVKRIEG